MLLTTRNAWGQASYNHTYTAGVEVAAGENFFLYNIGANLFYACGMDWGTHAAADHAGLCVRLDVATNGFFIYGAPYSPNGTPTSGFLSTAAFADYNETADKADCVFAPVSVAGYTNVYTIKNGENYLSYNSADTKVNWGASTNDNYSYWMIIPKSVRDAAGDFTYYLQNTGINRKWERQVWCGYDWSQNNPGDWQDWPDNGWSVYPHYTIGGLDSNPCAEKFHKTKDFYQTISQSVPNGKYTLYAQGFYRQDGEVQDAPLLYANSDSRSIGVKTGTEDNMNDASTSFNEGKYVNSVSTVVTNNTLRVGINITGDNQWVIFDNFVLDYLGTCLASDATALSNGATMTAGKWYYFDATVAGTYEFSASSNVSEIIYTTDGDQVTKDATGSALSASMALEATRYYFKSTSAQTLTIDVPIGAQIANADINFTNDIVDGSVAGALNSMALSNTAGSTPFVKGYDGNNTDVLRVGKGTGTVTIPTAQLAGIYDEVILTFDYYFGRLNKRNAGFYLRDASNNVIGGLYFCAYDNSGVTNSFVVDLSKITSVGGSGQENDAILAATNKTTFEIHLNYALGTMYLKQSTNGTLKQTTTPVAMGSINPLASFAIESNYDNDGRRCWFDNLVINTIKGDQIKESATIGATGWTTFASAYPLDLSKMTASEGDVKAYYASSQSGSNIVMTSTDQTVAAGTGLMLKGTAGATITIPVAISGTGIVGNMLVGCTTETPVDASASCYVLINNGGTAEFQSLKDNGATIPAGKAYLNTGVISPARLIISFDEEDPTAINAVEAVDVEANGLKDGKYLIDGKIVLVKNGVKYGANGQKLN